MPGTQVASRPANASRILANTAYRAIADIGSKLVSVAFFVAIARLLGDEGFGVFTFGLAYASIVTVLAGFGQDAVMTKAVAREPWRVHEYFANAALLKLLLTIPILGLGAVLGTLLGMEPTVRDASLLLGLGVAAELLTNTCFAVFSAHERLGFMPVVLVFQRVVTASLGITAMLLGAKVVAVAGIYAFGALAAFGLALTLVSRGIVRPRFDLRPRRWGPLMVAAFPFGVALVLQVVLFRADAAILKLLEPVSVVGQYGAAYRLFESTLFLGWAVGAAIFPVLARVSGHWEAARAVVERGLKLVVASTLPVSVGAALVGGSVIRLLYGDEFSSSGTALAILAPTIVLASMNHVAGLLLLAANRQRYIATVYGILAVENIAANFVLIPWLSLNGAALNTTLTEVMLVVAVVGAASRLTGGIDWRRILSAPLVAGAVMAMVVLALRWEPALALAAGLTVYGLILVALERALYPEDAQTILNFVRGRLGARGARATGA